MSYKTIYKDFTKIIQSINDNVMIYNEFNKVKIINEIKNLSELYNGNFNIYNLEYKCDLYETYIIDILKYNIAFVFTIYEKDGFLKIKLTTLDYEYLLYISNYEEESYLIDIFYGSMLNVFTKISCDIDQFTYELILLKKFNKEFINEKIVINNISNVYDYLNIVNNKLKRVK